MTVFFAIIAAWFFWLVPFISHGMVAPLTPPAALLPGTAIGGSPLATTKTPGLLPSGNTGSLPSYGGSSVIHSSPVFFADPSSNLAYVQASASIASAADYLFQPAYLAVGPISLITAASFPAFVGNYIAKTSHIGVKIGDIIQWCKDHASSFPIFNQAVADSTTALPSIPSDQSWQTGQIIDTPQGARIITSGWSVVGTYYGEGYVGAQYRNWFVTFNGDPVSFYPTDGRLYRWDYTGIPAPVGGTLYKLQTVPTTQPSTMPFDQALPDYNNLKDKLVPPQGSTNPDLANEIVNAIRDVPTSQITPANVLPATGSVPLAPTLTQGEINDVIRSNAYEVTQKALEATQDAAASDPTNTVANIAALQAAQQAAQLAAQQAAEQAIQNQPPPEEPTYPTAPATWYTKSCDISQGLGSCLNYGQVLSATTAFQSTAIYQVPNLILSCLGYVSGTGCEYPPKITIDFHNHFTPDPIKIDLTPFNSVVNVMKFFFALICLVGTGKAVMVLFG